MPDLKELYFSEKFDCSTFFILAFFALLQVVLFYFCYQWSSSLFEQTVFPQIDCFVTGLSYEEAIQIFISVTSCGIIFVFIYNVIRSIYRFTTK